MTPEQIREQMTGRKTERRAYRELTGGSMPPNWQRHTVDLIPGESCSRAAFDAMTATQQVDFLKRGGTVFENQRDRGEADLAAKERGMRRAKYAWMFMVGCALGYVLGRWVAPAVLGS